MPYYQASVWEISVGLDQLIPLFLIHKTSVWSLGKQDCVKYKTLGYDGWLVGFVTYLTPVGCRRWLLMLRDRGGRERAVLSSRQWSHATWEGAWAKATMAELKTLDCTQFSHGKSVFFCFVLFWSTESILLRWSWICPWTASITRIHPPCFGGAGAVCLSQKKLHVETFIQFVFAGMFMGLFGTSDVFSASRSDKKETLSEIYHL